MEMRKFRLLDKKERTRGVCYAVNYAGAEYIFSRKRSGKEVDRPIPSGWCIEEIGHIPSIQKDPCVVEKKAVPILESLCRIFGIRLKEASEDLKEQKLNNQY